MKIQPSNNNYPQKNTWGGYQKRYTPKQQYGRSKEDWEEKDLITEYNILTAQAYNLAYDKFWDSDQVYPETKRIIAELIKLRQDPEVKRMFMDFKEKKINEAQRKVETKDIAKTEAELDAGIADFGDTEI